MPRGLHLSDETNHEDGPCLDVELHSSPHTEEIQLTIRKRKPKFDPTRIVAVKVDVAGKLKPSSDCSQLCSYYFLQSSCEEGVTWKKVTAATKRFYWGEFKKSITHVGFDESLVYEAWNRRASKRYNDWLSKLSKRKQKPQKGVGQKAWDAWTAYWKTDEFKKKSERGSKNRHRDGKGMVNHTGGSQAFDVFLEKLQQNGLNPDPAEFHKLTHSRKVNNELVFCDDYAAEVNAAYLEKERKALLELQTQAEGSGSPVATELPMSTKVALFKEAAGGERKGGVYGAGTAAKHFYSLKSRGSTSLGLSQGSSVEAELRDKIRLLEEAQSRMKEERDEAESRMKEERDEAIALAIGETNKRAEKMEKMIEKLMRKRERKKNKTKT